MGPSKIQRGIESRHARTMDDGPNLGRVVRLRDVEGAVKGSGGGLRGAAALAKHAAQRRVLLTWSLILSLITLVVVGGFMMFWLFTHENQDSRANPGRTDEEVRVASKFVSPGEEEALALVQRALTNRDPAKVQSFFHLGGASPEEVMEFLAGTPARDGTIDRYVWLSSIDVDGLLMDGVLVIYTGKKIPGERLASLTPDPRGVWKVDFDAFARSSRPPWKDLLEKRADHAQVRVFVAKDNYFNGPFQNEGRWICYGMVSPESKELLPVDQDLLHGYCKVGSPQAKAMERVFSGDVQIKRVTLEIRRPEGGNARQFEITRVLAEDWVLTASPLDGKFSAD